MKRFEIITAAQNTKKIQTLLDRNQIDGYTFLPRVAGQGSQGYMDADGLSMAFQNVYFLIGCSNEEFERISPLVKNLLDNIGGVAFVSDGEWVKQ